MARLCDTGMKTKRKSHNREAHPKQTKDVQRRGDLDWSPIVIKHEGFAMKFISPHFRIWLILAFAPGVSGCQGLLADMSSEGELNEEYRLKHLYSECLKASATSGVECSDLKHKLSMQQEWNAMDGGV